MTPADLTAARKRLGLTAAALGRLLELEGRDPGRAVRQWENGGAMPGPARVAVRLLLEAQARQSLQDATDEALAILAPASPSAPVLSQPEATPVASKTRRRG